MTALQTYRAGELHHPETLERLHTRSCVDGRHLAMPIEDYYKMWPF
jgi:hypothetical protein